MTVTDAQVRIIMRERNKGRTQEQAAASANVRSRQTVQQGEKLAMIGADGTYMRLKGKHTGIEVVVDKTIGELLGLEIVVSESHKELMDV